MKNYKDISKEKIPELIALTFAIAVIALFFGVSTIAGLGEAFIALAIVLFIFGVFSYICYRMDKYDKPERKVQRTERGTKQIGQEDSGD